MLLVDSLPPQTVAQKAEHIRKKALIEDIIQACQANNVPSLDDVLLGLALSSEKALRKIAQTLYIKTPVTK